MTKEKIQTEHLVTLSLSIKKLRPTTMTAPGAQTTVRTSMQIEILVHNSAARNALYAKVDKSAILGKCILYLWKDSVLVAGLVGEV
jgi:hypothetical protein